MTLDEASEHIGEAVVYMPVHGNREDGTIVRVGQNVVFVRYGHLDSNIKGTYPQDLTLLADSMMRENV